MRVGVPQRNISTRLDTLVIEGEPGRAIYVAKYRRRSRTGTCQQSATGKPREAPGTTAGADGRAMETRARQRAPRRRELTGLVADAGVVEKGERRQARVRMNYDGSVSQRQENVGRYILRNIPILWAAPAPSDEPGRRGVFRPLSGRETPTSAVARAVVVNEYR